MRKKEIQRHKVTLEMPYKSEAEVVVCPYCFGEGSVTTHIQDQHTNIVIPNSVCPVCVGKRVLRRVTTQTYYEMEK